jgi:hypothetical protein
MRTAEIRVAVLLTVALALPLTSCGTTGDDAPGTLANEGSSMVPASASSAQWPAMTDDESSVLSAGILGKVLDKFPAALLARDTLIQPGETARVEILLGRGFGSTALETYDDQRIIVSDVKGNAVLSEMTNRDGKVVFERTYEAAGNYYYRVACDGTIGDKKVTSVLFGVYVRDKDAPIVICDMDKTLVKSSFARVLAGIAGAFDHSVNVMDRLVDERKMTVVYLTHRPDFLNTESRNWLRKQKFPPGPLLGSNLSGLLSGSEKFKTAEIAKLKKRYPKILLAIGDKIADSNAYVSNGVRSVLLPDIEWDEDEGKYWREKLTDMAPVGDEVTVCNNWYEIEDAIFKSQSFPPARVRQRIQEMARKYQSDD